MSILQHSMQISSDEEVQQFIKRVTTWLRVYKPNRILVDIQSELIVPLKEVLTLQEVTEVARFLMIHSMLNIYCQAVVFVYHSDDSIVEIKKEILGT
jgi:hypothetical protein